MVQAIEEMKVSSDEEVRAMRSAVNISDEMQTQQDMGMSLQAQAFNKADGRASFRTSNDSGLNNSQKLTDPIASYKNVQDHFEKI